MFPSTQPSHTVPGTFRLASRMATRLGLRSGFGEDSAFMGRASRWAADVGSHLASQVQSRLPGASRFGLGSGFGVASRGGGSTEMSSLSPSLLQDLMRFERTHGEQRELLEVLAASVRHTQSLAIRLDNGSEWVTLTVFPLERLVHCRLPLDKALGSALLPPHGQGLRVVQVQPATHRPPHDLSAPGSPAAMRAAGGDESDAAGGSVQSGTRAQGYTPLAPVLWAVALAGSRAELLPELAGQAAYRLAPGLPFNGLPVPQELEHPMHRLRRETVNLRDLAGWPIGPPARGARRPPVLGRERAIRLLNALYLQSALIISRTHPAATNDGWSGYVGRRA